LEDRITHAVISEISIIKEKLPEYLSTVKSKHSEPSKAYTFISFIQKIFDIESRDLDFEVPVKSKLMELRGRIDATFGNLIFEFKKNLEKDLEEGKRELKLYFQDRNEKFPDSDFIGIINDGVVFRVFHPIFDNKKIIEIDEKGFLDLDSSNPEKIFLWFDSYFFSTQKIIPTSADIKQRFGLESPTYVHIQRKLKELFEKTILIYKPALIKYENWARYLSIVRGEKQEKDLFFRHTYLSTLVKLIIHSKLVGSEPSIYDPIPPLLWGNRFRQAGILNFIEDDIFTWTLSKPIRKQSSKLFENLLRSLYIYDLEKINEDVLKELYQELVAPESRKLLGEFYTPDWLADKMVEEVLKDDPTLKVMDPSCGSGTFLFKTIQFKIKALTEKGWNKEKILTHLLENVIGFDIHPVAIVIAKTNYFLALKDLHKSKRGPISIPVYLSDSLKIPQKKPESKSGVATVDYEAGDVKFRFPLSIASNIAIFDDVIEKMKSIGEQFGLIYEKNKESDPSRNQEAYERLSNESFARAISDISKEKEKQILIQTLRTLFDLIKTESDSIWTHILRNMYKPISIFNNKVDVLIGNPPWLGLNKMKSRNYQKYLKEQSKYYKISEGMKRSERSGLNLAPLFFCQCIDQYLKDKGKIAFVMPHSVIEPSQHKNFLKFKKIPVKLTEIYDLEKVKPLFRTIACVLVFYLVLTALKHPSQ